MDAQTDVPANAPPMDAQSRADVEMGHAPPMSGSSLPVPVSIEALLAPMPAPVPSSMPVNSQVPMSSSEVSMSIESHQPLASDQMPASDESTSPVEGHVDASASGTLSPQGQSEPPSSALVGMQFQESGLPSPTSSRVRRRARVACRRCRRMRTKCVHDQARPPCQACLEAGIGASECIFPVRGQPDQDREYRHPRDQDGKLGPGRDPATVRREILDAPLRQPGAAPRIFKYTNVWDLLPPLAEIIEAVNQFTRHYFQLGFIPKRQFPTYLRENQKQISPFYLLGILSVSARLTPSLVRRYGNAVTAAEIFMERASTLAVHELYQGPSLERCQAFYLLSIAQQGSAMNSKSAINMAIAMRMATLLQLHREETYQGALRDGKPEHIIQAESARRTLWMLHSQDNLHSGPRSPVSLSAGDITALLPGHEMDFALGREPSSRAALEDTPPAIEKPSLVYVDGRSLFATLVQAHYYWGAISRRAISNDKSKCPWDKSSEYAKMVKRLDDWESKLPPEHRWLNPRMLRVYKREGEDLAYLNVTMITRLCNIVLRKAYLHEMISRDKCPDTYLRSFWTNMSRELFENVNSLYEQIDTQYADRGPGEGMGGQMAAFCIYTCGFLSAYLIKYPNLCPSEKITRKGPAMVEAILNIVRESKGIWPLASRWLEHLEGFYKAQNDTTVGVEGSMADSREPIPHALEPTIKPRRPVPRPNVKLPSVPLPPAKLLPRPEGSPAETNASPQDLSPGSPSVGAHHHHHHHQPSYSPTDYEDHPSAGSHDMTLPPITPQQMSSHLVMSSTHHSPAPGHDFSSGVSPSNTLSGPSAAGMSPVDNMSGVGMSVPMGSEILPPIASALGGQDHGHHGVGRSTDGLGLLLEAFDSHQSGVGGGPYDPATQEYYATMALAMDDGYESELTYYMNMQSGDLQFQVQNFVVGGNVYGY